PCGRRTGSWPSGKSFGKPGLRLNTEARRAGQLEALFEEELGVGIVVEAGDLGPAGLAVERRGLGERGVGVEAEEADAELARHGLDPRHEPGGEARAAGGGRDPEPLDLGPVALALQPDAGDRALRPLGKEEDAARPPHGGGFGIAGERHVEAAWE